MFNPYFGDTKNLTTNENYLNFKWDKANVLFSVTRRGNACVIHLTSNKSGLRRIKQAINEFCEFCFWLFDWAEMIIGPATKDSVVRIAEKCGFKLAGVTNDNISIMVRSR